MASSARTSAPAGPSAYIAEFVGTLLLVFGIGAAVSANSAGGIGSTDFVTIGLVHGLLLAGLVAAFAGISGANLNPAVTIALVAIRKLSPSTAVVYIIAQLLGAVSAGRPARACLQGRRGDRCQPRCREHQRRTAHRQGWPCWRRDLRAPRRVRAGDRDRRDRRARRQPRRGSAGHRPHARRCQPDHRTVHRWRAQPGSRVRPRPARRRVRPARRLRARVLLAPIVGGVLAAVLYQFLSSGSAKPAESTEA